MYVESFVDGKEEIEGLQERITGRFSCETIKNKDGEVIVKANHMITPKRAARIMKEGVDNQTGGSIEKVKIRTILTCKCKVGICAKCYGANLATGEPVQVGESVGIIAAQSIGEPGTQLTMRTFHSGGVAGGDITQGLPRVEELFEARKPKGLAIITEIPGVAVINDTKKKREVIVTDQETGESKTYLIPYGSRIKITDGQILEAGDELTEGSVNPHDILRIKGVRAVQDYMIREVQRVYRLQGVEISDKHIEVIVRQMLKKSVSKITEIQNSFLEHWLTSLNTRTLTSRWKKKANSLQMENRLCLVLPRHLLLQTPSCQPLPSRKQLKF